MASPITHAFFTLAASKAGIGRKMPLRFWLMTAFCATIPDIDIFWRRLAANRSDIWSHRGITHSLLGAAVIGLLVAIVYRWMRPRDAVLDEEMLPNQPRSRGPSSILWLLWLFFGLATLSHAILDMLSSGYYGVMLLAPFSNQHFAFGWQPVWSAPGALDLIFPRYGGAHGGGNWLARAAMSEVLVVWVPMTILMAVSKIVRQARRKVPVTVAEK